MPQAVAHGRELPDALVELVGLVQKLSSVDANAAARGKHMRDLLERESGAAAERDEREAE
jgi:hypothetical protein